MPKKKKRNTKRNRKPPTRSLPKPQSQKKGQSRSVKFLYGLAEDEIRTTLGGWKPDLGTFVADKLNVVGVTRTSQLLLGPCYLNTILEDRDGSIVNFVMGISCFGGKTKVYLGSLIIKGKKPEQIISSLGMPGSSLRRQGANLFTVHSSYPLVFIRCRVEPDKAYRTYQTEENVVPFVGEVFLHNGPLVREAIEETVGFHFSELEQVLVLRDGFVENIQTSEEEGKEAFEKLLPSASTDAILEAQEGI